MADDLKLKSFQELDTLIGRPKDLINLEFPLVQTVKTAQALLDEQSSHEYIRWCKSVGYLKLSDEKRRCALEKLLQDGNREAGMHLGAWYGVRGDLERALSYIKLSAEQGHLRACVISAQILEQEGNVFDPAEAKRWWLAAADGGDGYACIEVGDRYGRFTFRNECFRQEWEKAVAYYRRALSFGRWVAYRELGLAYGFGRAVPEDTKRCIQYLRLAAKAEDEEATHILAGLCKEPELKMRWLRTGEEIRQRKIKWEGG